MFNPVKGWQSEKSGFWELRCVAASFCLYALSHSCNHRTRFIHPQQDLLRRLHVVAGDRDPDRPPRVQQLWQPGHRQLRPGSQSRKQGPTTRWSQRFLCCVLQNAECLWKDFMKKIAGIWQIAVLILETNLGKRLKLFSKRSQSIFLWLFTLHRAASYPTGLLAKSLHSGGSELYWLQIWRPVCVPGQRLLVWVQHGLSSVQLPSLWSGHSGEKPAAYQRGLEDEQPGVWGIWWVRDFHWVWPPKWDVETSARAHRRDGLVLESGSSGNWLHDSKYFWTSLNKMKNSSRVCSEWIRACASFTDSESGELSVTVPTVWGSRVHLLSPKELWRKCVLMMK